MINMEKISISVQEGNTLQTVELVTAALQKKHPPAQVLKEGLAAGMIATEKRFSRNEIHDTEVLLAECAMKAGLNILMPVLEEGQTAFSGTVITGTLEGDIREIEKDILSCLLQSHGLNVVDLGVNVTNVQFIEAAIEEKAQVIACTTALTIFLPQMKSLVQAAAQADIRGKTRILLCGRPVTEWFCKSIEADMYASCLVQAAETAAEFCRKTGAASRTTAKQ